MQWPVWVQSRKKRCPHSVYHTSRLCVDGCSQQLPPSPPREGLQDEADEPDTEPTSWAKLCREESPAGSKALQNFLGNTVRATQNRELILISFWSVSPLSHTIQSTTNVQSPVPAQHSILCHYGPVSHDTMRGYPGVFPPCLCCNTPLL